MFTPGGWFVGFHTHPRSNMGRFFLALAPTEGENLMAGGGEMKELQASAADSFSSWCCLGVR